MKKPRSLQTSLVQYTVQDVIGQGGCGTVYRAANDVGCHFAIKVLDKTHATTSKIKRFRNELQFCLEASHPNIIKVVDHGLSPDGHSFFVMPLYDGSLRTLIGSLEPNIALGIFASILDGVEYLHSKGVVHRDLKPQNILYKEKDTGFEIAVADLGIARFSEEHLCTAVLTQDDDRLANFQYCAPEQRMGRADVDRRADIYALGLMLNELFTQKLAQGTDYRKIASVAPAYEYLDYLVEEMLQQEPNERVEDGQVVKKEIEKSSSKDAIRYRRAYESLKLKASRLTVNSNEMSSEELKSLWIGCDHPPVSQIGHSELCVIVMSMAMPDDNCLAIVSHNYGHDIEDDRGTYSDPSKWYWPGWCWLSDIKSQELLDLSRRLITFHCLGGSLAFLRIVSLLGTSKDFGLLCEVLKRTFWRFPMLAEDTIAVMSRLVDNSHIPSLRRMAEDPQPIVRRAAAICLGKISDKSALDVLFRLAKDKKPNAAVGGDVNVRGAAAESIGMVGDPSGLKVLREMIHNEGSGVLFDAVRGLGRLGLFESLDAFRGVKSYILAIHAAARYYVGILCKWDICNVRQLAGNGDQFEKEGAAWILRDRGNASDLPLLRKLAKSSDRRIKNAAISAIGRIGNDEDLPLVRKIATDFNAKNWTLRMTAVRSLGHLGKSSDVEVLRHIAACDPVEHIVGRCAGHYSWLLMADEHMDLIASEIKKPTNLYSLSRAIQAFARLCSDDQLLNVMGKLITDSRPTVARIAAESIMRRVNLKQLQDFVSKHKNELAPAVLAVFDWCLYAPDYLKAAYPKWKDETDKVPPWCW